MLAVVQVCVVAAAFDHALKSDADGKIADEAGDAISSAALSSSTTPEAARPSS